MTQCSLPWCLNKRCLSCRGQGCGDVYVALNAHNFEVQAALPAPTSGCKWARLVVRLKLPRLNPPLTSGLLKRHPCGPTQIRAMQCQEQPGQLLTGKQQCSSCFSELCWLSEPCWRVSKILRDCLLAGGTAQIRTRASACGR